MKKADVTTESGTSYHGVILIENVSDLMDVHNHVFGSEFDNELKEKLLSLKTEDDVTPEIGTAIRRAKRLAPQTRICLMNQLNDVLRRFNLSMNYSGGYFPFRPEKSKITMLKR